MGDIARYLALADALDWMDEQAELDAVADRAIASVRR